MSSMISSDLGQRLDESWKRMQEHNIKYKDVKVARVYAFARGLLRDAAGTDVSNLLFLRRVREGLQEALESGALASRSVTLDPIPDSGKSPIAWGSTESTMKAVVKDLRHMEDYQLQEVIQEDAKRGGITSALLKHLGELSEEYAVEVHDVTESYVVEVVRAAILKEVWSTGYIIHSRVEAAVAEAFYQLRSVENFYKAARMVHSVLNERIDFTKF